MNKMYIYLSLLLFTCFICPLSSASVPNKITYQGYLEKNNVAYTGTESMQFKIFDALTNGTPLWTSSQMDVDVNEGAFAAVIEPTGVDWFNKSTYIEIIIEGTALSPREPLYSVPYAIVASSAAGSTGDFKINTTNKLYLDGGDNTYIYETAADTMSFVVGGTEEAFLSDTEGLVTDYGFFHYRGELSEVDFDQDDLTTNGSWHDLGIADIVPDGAKAVLLEVLVTDDAVGSPIRFRKNGNTDVQYSVSRVCTMVANVSHETNVIVPCDSSGEIEYSTDNLTYTDIWIVVLGWWK